MVGRVEKDVAKGKIWVVENQARLLRGGDEIWEEGCETLDEL